METQFFRKHQKTSAMVNTQVNIKDFFNLLISLKYLGLFKTKLITLSYGAIHITTLAQRKGVDLDGRKVSKFYVIWYKSISSRLKVKGV